MDEGPIHDFLAALPGVDILSVDEARFYYYDPRRDMPHDRRQPFATLVRTDAYDGASDLERRGLFRVNLGVSRETYRGLFGPEPAWNPDGKPVPTGHDLTAVDVLLPHPYYSPMGWMCIVAPSEETWPRLQALLREAHGVAAAAFERRRRTR